MGNKNLYLYFKYKFLKKCYIVINQAVILSENILTKPSPPAVQNIFPLLEKSTLDTSLLRSWIEQKALYYYNNFF